MTQTAELARYKAIGTTDEVTECGICGREELKGTIVLAILDADGNREGEIYAGSSCGAKMSGRPVKELQAEAREADDVVRQAFRNWGSAHHDNYMAVTGAWLAAQGLPRTYPNVKMADADAGVQAELAAWDAANPRPTER